MSHPSAAPIASRPQQVVPVALDEVVGWVAGWGAEAPRWAARAAEGTVVTGVSLSSGRVLPGDLYAALAGQRAHGVDFAAEAVAAGAVAVLTDHRGAERLSNTRPLPDGVGVLVVHDPRGLLGRLAARLYGDPAQRLRVIGVTGTQGKTTTTRLLEAGLQGSGVHAAVVGTNGTRIDGEEVPTSLTTPEAPDLHGLFAVMLERGVRACAMEVSSHALVLGRVDGVVFDVAVFCNLGRDHLDFHTDLEDYFAAKASMFDPARARLGLVNVDDEHGRRLLHLAAERGLTVRTFSPSGREADWSVRDVESGPDSSTFTVLAPGGTHVPARSPLPGAVNVANVLAAVAAAGEAGFDATSVAEALGRSGGVPGRFERVSADGAGRTVLVDYAHKPDAVEAALRTLRPLTRGRLAIVIGAGGDRDTGKRPLMGAAAARLADLVVVTDDNPRTEDAAAIRAEVLAGALAEDTLGSGQVDGGAEVLEVAGRRDAIEVALRATGEGDVVLVAGKGHESGQEVHGVVHPFDDRTVTAQLLVALEEATR